MEIEKKTNLINTDKQFIKIGNRKFFCKGKCSILIKPIGLIITLLLILFAIIGILYLTIKYIKNYLYKNLIIIISISIFEIFQILIVGLSNPGAYLPNFTNEIKDNRTKMMIASINKQEFFLKYCPTCFIARDLRVFHCKYCNLCILRHDHHCPWLSNCIGIYNRKKFLLLVLIGNCFNVIYIYFLFFYIVFPIDKSWNFGFVFSIILLSFILISFLFHIFLSIAHFIYISSNKTTSENIRQKNKNNPYTLNNCLLNIKEFWFNPTDYKNRFTYNDNAKFFLQKNTLIIDYIQNIDKIYPDRNIRNLITNTSEINLEMKDKNTPIDSNLKNDNSKLNEMLVEEKKNRN